MEHFFVCCFQKKHLNNKNNETLPINKFYFFKNSSSKDSATLKNNIKKSIKFTSRES